MPTLLREGGFRVVVYTNDHRPAHVHVQGDSGEAVFELHCPKGPPELREVYGFRHHVLNRIAAMLSGHLDELCAGWSKVHGGF